MKLINFEKKEKITEKKLNKKKVFGTIIIIVCVIIFIMLASFYITNTDFRNFVDTNIFRKNITENNATSIIIEKEKNPYFYAYDKYIVKLEENILTRYNSNGKEDEKNKIEISNPLFTSNAKSLVVAEKGKQRIYSIIDKQIIWQKDLEGNISRISVNKNGYVAVILTGTTYKSVIVVFDKDGKELFRMFLANNIAVDSTISDDCKYLSFAEIDTAGTIIKSTIKTISIEKAKQKPDEAIIYSIDGENNSIIINIKYQEKNTLLALYNDKIDEIKNDNVNTIKKLNNKDEKVSFSDIELTNSVYRVLEKTIGFFNSNSTVEITNSLNNRENLYMIDAIAKNVYSNENIIAINTGMEAYFISANNGWIVKKYSSKKEIKDIVLTSKIAGIIYHDKIELIDL